MLPSVDACQCCQAGPLLSSVIVSVDTCMSGMLQVPVRVCLPVRHHARGPLWWSQQDDGQTGGVKGHPQLPALLLLLSLSAQAQCNPVRHYVS